MFWMDGTGVTWTTLISRRGQPAKKSLKLNTKGMGKNYTAESGVSEHAV